MTWNYRVVKYEDGTLGLHEAYYGLAKLPTLTERPIVVGETRTELLRSLRMMMRDIKSDSPVLDLKTRKEIK